MAKKKRRRRAYITGDLLTQSELLSLAGKLAGQELNPQVSALNRQAASQDAALTGATAAQAELLKGIGPGIEGAYQRAGQNLTEAGSGFAGNMRSILDQENTDRAALLARLGDTRPTGSLADAANVTYGSGAYLPARNLAEAGAATGAAARLLPATASRIGTQNLTQQQAAHRQALSELLATRPGLVSKNFQDLANLELQRWGTRINENALGVQQQGNLLDYSLGQQNLAADTAAAAASAGAKGKKDKTQTWYSFRGKAFDRAEELFKGNKVTVTVPNPNYDPDKSELYNNTVLHQTKNIQVTKNAPVKWPKARRQLLTLVSGPLRRQGFSQKRINTMVVNALLAAGYKRPTKKPPNPGTYGQVTNYQGYH